MRVYSLAHNAAFPDVLRRGAVSIGNFDGVHRGHVALLKENHQQARYVGGPAIAMTFDPHPLRLLAPERFLPQLTTASDRAELFLHAGMDRVVVLRTTPELLQLSATQFLDLLIGEQLQAKFLVEGFNFGFGRGREGNVQILEEWSRANNVGLTVVPSVVMPDGEPISSSRVRDALNSGNVSRAADLLGRPYRLRGVVARGARRGVVLGYPTANLVNIETLVPGDGVYAGRAVMDGKSWLAAINIGPNPTFGVEARKVEAHLLDFAGDLYDAPLAIDVMVRLRDVERFDSKEGLITQLEKDVAQVRGRGSHAS